jgi:hypothetical protein
MAAAGKETNSIKWNPPLLERDIQTYPLELDRTWRSDGKGSTRET